MKRAVKILLGAAASTALLWGMAQQGDLEVQNAVKTRSEERLAEIEKLSKALSGDIVRSESDLRVARSAIAAKRKIVDDLDREARRIADEITGEERMTRRLDSTLAALKADYGRMVREAWKNRKTSGMAQFLFASRDFNDASRRISFIRRYNRARERRGAGIDSLNRRLLAEIERLRAKKVETAALRDDSDRLLADLSKEEERYRQKLDALGADRKKLEDEAIRERRKIAAAQKEIDRIMESQALAAKGTALTEADIALSGQFGENKGRLPWPTGAPGLILHHFGKERSADGIESDFKGLIIAARPGSAVRSVFEGTVTWISDLGQYDKCVMVRSGEYVVGYGNIASSAVRSGDRVTTGQSLGMVNTSGESNRHLVLVWMQKGNAVLDPEEWLR